MRVLLFIWFIILSSCSKGQIVYYPCMSGDITFVDSTFQYSVPGYQRTNFIARSTGAYVEFTTSEINISIKIGGNWSGHITQSDCEVLVNGVYYQSVRLSADNVTETYPITLPVGEKLVRLVNGYTANPSTNINNVVLPENGVYVQGVVTDSSIKIVKPIIPDHKWLFIGNSITTGANATHPAITDFLSLLRNDGKQIQSDSWGARRLLTYTTTFAHDMATFISPEMNGLLSNELFMFLGTNNFYVGGGQPKATFKLEVQSFLDSVHSQRPDIKIYLISPMIRNNYSVPNAQGATCEDYADAMRELLVTRVWAKFIYGKDLVSLSNLTDGVHPNQVGHQEIHDKFLIQYNQSL
jgi:lysophospholipase L1-like esterase